MNEELATMSPPTELQVLIDDADLESVDRYLTNVDPDDRTQIRHWFERSRPWFREQRSSSGRHQPSTMWYLLPWVEGICALALLGPATAAKRVPWRDLHWFSDLRPLGMRILQRRLEEADPAWAARFAEAANGVSLPARDSTSSQFAGLLRATVVHHGLPCPTSSTFLQYWLIQARDEPGRARPDDTAPGLAKALRDDPLMPGLLWNYLASGHCGDVPQLPDALASLVTEGLVERDQLIDTVLAQLTAPPRVASQRVLANILTAVDITPVEIAGGLDYLLGVIATAHGSVGKVLLPQAIELATEAGELEQLADVVASRPERAQKDLLLRRLRDRADQPGVIDALQTLVAGDDDAAFVAKVQTVIDRHRPAAHTAASAEAPTEPPQPGSMGLWDLRPPPELTPGRPEWIADRPGVLRDAWSGQLIPGTDAQHLAWVLSEILAAPSDGEDAGLLAEVATNLLNNDAVSLPRLSQTFEDLFLSGAMSQTWPAALAVADAVCGRRPRPARTEVFLRMLARYANEAPSQELPLRIAGFAAAPGGTKAQVEARALGAALSGETPDAYVARIRAAGALPAAQQAPGPSLWQERPTAERGDAAPVPAVAAIDPEAVARALVDYNTEPVYPAPPPAGARPAPFDVTGPDLLLRDVLRGVKVYGIDQWRDYLGQWAQGRSAHLGPVSQAIGLWAQGGLTLETYWKLALRSITWAEWTASMRTMPNGSVPSFADLNAAQDLLLQSRTDPPVLPPALSDPASRVMLMWTAEVLLRMHLDPAHRPASLALAAFQDGTIDLPHLTHRLNRLHEGGNQIGPLDLVMALYRLPPSDPAEVDSLRLPPMMTVPELTSPDGRESWDAAELIRRWVQGGGAGPASAGQRTDEHGWPIWTVRSDPAVPWSSCRAAPPDLDEQDERSSPFGPTVRVFPLQPDRVAMYLHHSRTTFVRDFAYRQGGFGPASRRHILQETAQVGTAPSEQLLDLLAHLKAKDLIDPRLMGETARQLMDDGQLSLQHLCESWRRIFRGGGLADLWPIAVAVTEELARMSPPPTRLRHLVDLLTEFVSEVPADAGPDRVRALAGTVA